MTADQLDTLSAGLSSDQIAAIESSLGLISSALTSEQLANIQAAITAVADDDYAALQGAGDAPTYFRIAAINDPERRRKWQVVDAVEVTA